MIALLERRQQLYRLIGITGAVMAVAASLFVQLPSDVHVSFRSFYTVDALLLGMSLVIALSPRWLNSHQAAVWLVVGAIFPTLEALAVYFTGGVRSPFFVFFYFSLFFMGMVGGHVGATASAVVSGILYVAACELQISQIDHGSLMLRFSATLASFYGIAMFAALLGNIAGQEAMDAERRAMRIVGLNAVNSSLGGVLDLDLLLERIPRALCDQLGFERAVLYLLRDGRLVAASAHAVDPAGGLDALMGYWREHPIALDSDDVLAQSLRQCRPIAVLDPRRDPRVNKAALSLVRSRSFAVAPLVAKDVPIGVICADYYRQPRTIGDEELHLLSTFASLAALAITNCRLAVEAGKAEALRQLDALKTEFLTMVSHELRTPLTLIRASADLLIEDASAGMDCTQRQLVRTVSQNCERLTEFLQEIIEMAQLQEGRIRLSTQVLDLRELVEEVAQSLHLMVSRKRQRLCLDFPPVACRVEVDRHRLQQVITNLMTNACKYTPEGGKVWIRVRGDDESVTLEVRDNGPGIPEDKLPHVFEKFYRLPDTDGSTSGTGLGLAIARSLVELHGGSIGASSSPGEGTRFWLTLPRTCPGASAAEVAGPHQVEMSEVDG